MIRMFARHPVSDFSAWKKVYDGFDAERRGMGVTGDAVYQAAEDPKDITVSHDFETLEAAKAFAGSPRLKEVMENAGVAGEPTIWFTSKA